MILLAVGGPSLYIGSILKLGTGIITFMVIAASMSVIRIFDDRVAALSRRPVPVSTFLLDNSVLKADAPGLVCRFSKNFSDRSGENLRWGSTVKGIDEGDGWVKVLRGSDGWVSGFPGSRYLPLQIDSVPVLKLLPAEGTQMKGDEVVT